MSCIIIILDLFTSFESRSALKVFFIRSCFLRSVSLPTSLLPTGYCFSICLLLAYVYLSLSRIRKTPKEYGDIIAPMLFISPSSFILDHLNCFMKLMANELFHLIGPMSRESPSWSFTINF